MKGDVDFDYDQWKKKILQSQGMRQHLERFAAKVEKETAAVTPVRTGR